MAKDLDAELSDDLKGAEKALLAGQRGWIAYRDGQCDLAGFEARGGSMEPMLVSGCLADLTRKRTQELQAIHHRRRGAMSCRGGGPDQSSGRAQRPAARQASAVFLLGDQGQRAVIAHAGGNDLQPRSGPWPRVPT